AATPFTFTTLNDHADQTFNQLLGINDHATIAGYFGSGADAAHPNKGYTIVPPYHQSNYRNENFPGSAQTQVVGINNSGVTVGFYVNDNGANFGFVKNGAVFTSVTNPYTPKNAKFDQLLGINNKGVAVGFYVDAHGNSHGYTYNVSSKAFAAVN